MDVELVAKWFTPFNPGVIEYSFLSCRFAVRERVQSKFHAHPSSLVTEKRRLLNGVLQIKSIIVVSYINNQLSIHPSRSTHPSIHPDPPIHLPTVYPPILPPVRSCLPDSLDFSIKLFMQAIWFQFCWHCSIVCIASKEKHWWFYVTTTPPPSQIFAGSMWINHVRFLKHRHWWICRIEW